MHKLKEIRRDKLMTQALLAKKAGVALRTVHAAEKGDGLRVTTKRKILSALDIPFSEHVVIFGVN